jgi:hypothetical protein
LLGWHNNGATVFSVNLDECESVTTWAGQYDITSGRHKIFALWHLVHSNKPRREAILAGADVFTPAP